jgi:hypothetical protein
MTLLMGMCVVKVGFIQGKLSNIYYKCTDGWIKLVLRSTSLLTTGFNHLLRFHPMCSVEEVTDLINRPVVRLFGTRVNSTRAKIVYY